MQPQWGQQGYPAPRGYYPQPGNPAGAWGPPATQWGQPRPGWAQVNYYPAPQQLWGLPIQPIGYGQPRFPAPRPRRRFSFFRVLVVTFLIIVAGLMLRGFVDELLATPSPTTPSFPSAPYENEDYQVPPPSETPPELPMPDTYQQGTQWMINNSIYDATLAYPVRCEVAGVDPFAMTNAEMETRFNEFTACLMRVWAPALESQGFDAVRPTVTVYSGSVSTACGVMEDYNAAYCAADQQVYYADNLIRIIPANLQSSYYISEAILAHEFGHAVQARTGILFAEVVWEQNSDASEANNYSRRLEVQADCFAGQYIRAVATSVNIDQDTYANLHSLFYNIGDDVLSGDPAVDGNHGHGASRSAWFDTGSASSQVSSCNTFTASDTAVR